MTHNDSVLDRVLDAKALSDLDGSGEPRVIFKQFAKQCHPDRFNIDEDKEKAERAFVHLTKLRDKEAEPSSQPNYTIKSKKFEYTIDPDSVRIVDGIITQYAATYDAGHEKVWFSMPSSTADNDLMEAHVNSVKKLRDVPDQYRAFFPALVENFRYRDPSNSDRIVAVTSRDDYFIPLSKVKDEYPLGINGRNVAWIFRRMLVALGNAHELDIIHGAPTVDSFWIDAERHGIILDNRVYSVDNGSSLKAIPAQHKALYPEYALTKGTVERKLDIAIAAKTANSLLAEGEPRQLSIFFKGCQLSTVPPAAELLGEFDKLLLRIYGKPKFSELKL